MINDNAFWVAIWSIIAILILGIIGFIAFGVQSSNQKILDMVKAGASPIEAECAVGGVSSHNSLVCIEAMRLERMK